MVSKKVVLASLLISFMLALSISPVALSEGIERFEYYTTGEDANVEAQLDTWLAQTFKVGNYSHTVDYARIKLIDLGDNTGTLTLSIQGINASYAPDGTDICSATMSAADVSATATWYIFDFTDTGLEANTTYALVLRNSGIDIGWQVDGSSASYAGGSEWTSTDAGVLWAADTDDDYMFEIWGEDVLEVLDARVYTNFIESDDWLIVAEYKNFWDPYYPYYNPQDYFKWELIVNGSVVAQTPMRQWGYRPGSLYLSADAVTGFEWGNTSYVLRLNSSVAVDGSYPNSTYTLTDWYAGDLDDLDAWCLLLAGSMGDYYGTYFTNYSASGTVLNLEGGVLFELGIPYLSSVRPNIFEYVVSSPEWTEQEFSWAYQESIDWEEQFGEQISSTLTNFSTSWLGGDEDSGGRVLGGVLCFLVYGILAMLGVAKGHTTAGLVLAYPILIAGAWLGVIPLVVLGVVGLAAALMLVKGMFWSST